MQDTIFVVMKDNFMSGWGKAEGKTNLYVVACNTLQEANQIKAAAKTRWEMSNIRIQHHAPKDTRSTLVSMKNYSQLGGMWKGEE